MEEPENAFLKEALRWERKAADAVACLSLFRLLKHRAESVIGSTAKHPDSGTAEVASLGVVEANVAGEWRTLKRFLAKIDTSTSDDRGTIDRKGLNKRRAGLAQLRFLGFLVPACDDLQCRLLPGIRF
jgi:hypothetical protein